jgi:hypothetical protein
MKSNKQHFVDLGSKQKELARNEKNRIDQWAGKSRAQEHIAHNRALEEWDHIRQHHHRPEGVDPIGRHSEKPGSKRPL